MVELIANNPWLIVVCLGLMIPICGIVFGTVTNYRLKVRKAELQAGVIQEMLARGMSAEEIRMVLEAAPNMAGRRPVPDSAPGRA